MCSDLIALDRKCKHALRIQYILKKAKRKNRNEFNLIFPGGKVYFRFEFELQNEIKRLHRKPYRKQSFKWKSFLICEVRLLYDCEFLDYFLVIFFLPL